MKKNEEEGQLFERIDIVITKSRLQAIIESKPIVKARLFTRVVMQQSMLWHNIDE